MVEKQRMRNKVGVSQVVKGGVVAEGLVLILNINTNLVSCLALERFIDCSPHTNLLRGPGKTTSNTFHFLSCDSWKIIIPMKFICCCQCALPLPSEDRNCKLRSRWAIFGQPDWSDLVNLSNLVSQ